MPPKKKKQQNANAGKTRNKPRAYVIGRGLDDGARAYRALLDDPCNSTMVYPTYGATNSGYLIRTKQFFSMNATAADFVFEWMPARYTCGLWGGANATGGALGNAAAAVVAPPFLTTSQVVGAYRGIAGCIKVQYSGTELNRGGMISLSTYDGANMTAGVGIEPSTAAAYASNALVMKRPGEPLEIKWIPGVVDASNWWEYNSTTGETQVYNTEGTCVTVSGVNIPPGTILLEITMVWEWQPNPSSLINQHMNGPASSNTYQEVLHTLGNLGEFAVGATRVGKAAYQGAQVMYNTAQRIANVLNPPGPRIISRNRPALLGY